MDDEVEAVEVTAGSSESQAKPLMRLFKRLIGNDNKQNTVLTNSQIVNILKKEFQIDTDNLHELEVDIYLNVMKNYLKKWPQWDEFDQIITNLRAKGQQELISQILVTRYLDLKDYIQQKLDKVKPMAQSCVQEAIKKHVDGDDEFLDVVLEICCNREQLNSLFFRRPNKGKIINMEPSPPSTISLETLEFKDMFFWWTIGIDITTNRSSIHWQTVHELKHVLVNKKLNFPRTAKPLEQVIFATDMPAHKQHLYSISCIEEFLEEILKQSYSVNYVPLYTMELLIKVIKRDLEYLPRLIDGSSKYRRYLTKYPYIRYLYEDVADSPTNDWKYDIQLEETFKPQTQIYFAIQDQPSKFDKWTVTLKCFACRVEYEGHNMMESLRQHILSEHFSEPDWMCMNCHEKLSMISLEKTKHNCKANGK